MSAKSVTAKAANTTGVDETMMGTSSFMARFDHQVVPYILISPFFLLFGAFGIFPIVYSAIVSFKTFRLEYAERRDGVKEGLVEPTRRAIGFENFEKTLSQDAFWQALGNTFGIFIMATVPQLIMALILASLLNRRLRMNSLWRVGILLPFVTPIVASSLVFSVLFQRDFGQANWLLGLLGKQSDWGQEGAKTVFDGIDWRAGTYTAWLAISIMVNWKWVGYNALLYLAAMQSIPKDVYEAAALDGAGAWRQLWSITVPMIRPMVIFTVVLSTIGGLQLFAEPVLLDTNPASGNGGSRHQWRTVAQLIWTTGWGERRDFGYAGAMSWVLFFVVVAVAALNAYLSNRIGGGKR